MSIRAVVTRGFASGGSIPLVVARGYAPGAPVIPPVVDVIAPDAIGPVRKKSYRKEFEEDLQAVLAELQHVTRAAETIAAAPVAEMPRFEPAKARISDAMVLGLEQIHDALSVIQRTRLQMALAAAREAQKALEARQALERAAEERARQEMEALVARMKRRRRAAALAAAYLFGDDE